MNKFLVMLSMLTLMSCKSDLSKPSPFIEQQKMENILYDFALLYSIESVSAYSREEDSIRKIDINSLYKKYDIDSLTFVTNNRYYVELEDGVYNQMQNNILVRLEAAKVIADSLYSKLEANKENDTLNKTSLDDIEQLKLEKIDSVQTGKK
ncbi:DUF4296 domain-containing protein [Myroides sp. M-43]|uniref:DUF4296 domain-containing protein n=1 Tax=Myroides oncorhynchi TaxID=2893756 RepID=UPI001E344174|nr:DUF4296 domain-containing protein [Myroides oncorhynchi]MCC9041827.1 DUF4296 domain-containing protein [Myroides oncorhynchi]